MLSAASRLTHGSAGTFAINMPLTGTSGVEDRNAAAFPGCLYLRCGSYFR